jgi:hypothetical protein
VFKDKLKRKRTSSGRRDIYPVMLGVHQGVGARAENAKLPAAGRGQYEDVITTTKYNYAQLYITGQAKEFSTRKAFVDFAVRILKDTKEGLALDIGRQCWGDGSGTIALVNNGAGYAAGLATVAVDSAYGVLWGSVATNTTFLFKKNMTIAFGAEDNAGQGYAISSSTGTTITFTPPLLNAIVDNTKITRLGSAAPRSRAGSGSSPRRVHDRRPRCRHDGVPQHRSRASTPTSRGRSPTSGARSQLRQHPQPEGQDVPPRRHRGRVHRLPEILRDFEALLTTIARIVPATKLAYGATALEHDGLKWTKDKDAPVAAMHLCNSAEIVWAQRNEPTWKKQGDSIFRVVSGYDAEEATLMWYSNLDAPTRATRRWATTSRPPDGMAAGA